MHGKVITTIDGVALGMLYCHEHGADETTLLLSLQKQRKCRVALAAGSLTALKHNP